MSYQPQCLVIAGAGSAGCACALTAAQLGINAVLLEKSEQIGGTVSRSLIHTLGGLFDDQGRLLNPGLSAELIERLSHADPWTAKRRIGRAWTLSADPAVYAQVLRNWVEEEKKIQLYTQGEISRLHVSDGHVHEVVFRHEGAEHALPVHTLIDATGHAATVRLLDPDLISRGESLSGLILQLRDVLPDTIQFPRGAALVHGIRKAAAGGELPSECAALWMDSGVRPDEIYIKFNLLSSGRLAARMTGVIDCLLDWLRAVPGFEQVRLSKQGDLGVRDGGRIRGEYCLSESDIRSGKAFSDAVCYAAWPIEHWHPQHGLNLDYLPAGHSYTISKPSLSVRSFCNLFAVGKCLCAEPRAQASARVVGTCWAMGEGLVRNIFQEDQLCRST